VSAPSSPPAALRAEALVKTYQGAQEVEVLRGVDLSLAPGESLAVTGRSGSGKSTLLATLAGLELPTSGRVLLEGQDLAELDAAARARRRGQRIGFVFQAYRLLPTMTARENVALPLELAGAPEATARAEELLSRVGLAARADHLPAELSGGEQQRVALARALAPRPAVVLADEPTGSLDGETATAMANLLFEAAREDACALLVVTHDLELAARADQVRPLVAGRLEDEA
jgi:putative ABC transport system ATP-binding protein